jgi:serine/threonine-protein kinase 19
MCHFVFELCKCQQSLLDASLEDRLHTIHIHLSSLDFCCCLQVVRTFKLSTGQDDYGIMFTVDYLSQIEAAKKRLDLKESLLPELEVFDWFVAQVIPSCLDVGISHSHLLSLLSQGGSVKDSHVSLLMNAGLLVRQLVDETAYWFSIPNVGFLLKSISSGRKELLSFLSRRRYKEMLQAPLERHALRYSQLGLRFHLRDLLGLGQLHVVPSPSGPLIRVVHD